MTLTSEQHVVLDELMASGRKDEHIAQRLNMPLEVIAAMRVARRRKLKRERSRRERERRKHDPNPPTSIEDCIERRWGTVKIVKKYGCSEAEVDKVRRRLKMQRENIRLGREPDDTSPIFGEVPDYDDGQLLTALRAHHPPLTSLPERALPVRGIPVWCRRAAA